MLKVNNKDQNDATYFTPCFSVSIVNFEQVNAGCVMTVAKRSARMLLQVSCITSSFLTAFLFELSDKSERNEHGVHVLIEENRRSSTR